MPCTRVQMHMSAGVTGLATMVPYAGHGHGAESKRSEQQAKSVGVHVAREARGRDWMSDRKMPARGASFVASDMR